jgi:hypothetical protein
MKPDTALALRTAKSNVRAIPSDTANIRRPTSPLLQSELSLPPDQAHSRGMEDMVAHLKTLRVQIAECEMIRDLATDR